MNDDYYMRKTKKICPMCIFHTGNIPKEAIKLCPTHENRDNIYFSKGEIKNE